VTGALIVTALLPPDLHRWATNLRQQHFPPERNFLEAHVTLFHALPPSCETEVRDALAGEARRLAPVEARLEGVMPFGTGTALSIASPAMLDLRQRLADLFHGLLTSQDQHAPRLHVTIQNKVTASEAKALQAELAPAVVPRAFAFAGLGLYRYLGGPWDAVRTYPFRGRAKV
jgi:hypothetical protein